MENTNMQETKEKKTLSQVMEEHPTATFWSRFAAWALLACVLPFTFIAYRFQLFKTVSKVQIGGWGIFAIIILAVFAIGVFRYIKLALKTKYSFWIQCINGICKIVIPLLALYIILYNIRNNLDLFLQALGCVILCEGAAIPFNPMPKWVYEKQKEVRDEEKKDTVDYFIDQFFSKKNKEGE